MITRDLVPLRRLAAEITDGLGIRLPETKLSMLQSRLQRRMHALGLSTVAEYEQRLRDPAHASVERTALFDLATTNKTDFFRESAHFTFLANEALPALAAGRPRWTCRVWCAGCSTGQEAYTLAMVLDDYGRRFPGFTYEIVATDVSTRVLQEAVTATYDAELVEPVPATFRRRYLLHGRGERAGLVRVVPELRAKIRFSQLNFMDDRYTVEGPFDVVFFRNVMIYFDKPTVQQVVERQCALMRPGGYLFIAHTESLGGLTLPVVTVGNSVHRKRT